MLTEIALVLGASAWALVRLLALRRRTGAYGLSDALSAGAVGGVIGLAAGTVLCFLRDGAAHSGAGGLGAWVGRFLAFGGLALLEGAAVGAAVAFGLVRFSPRPGGEPPDNRDHAA